MKHQCENKTTVLLRLQLLVSTNLIFGLQQGLQLLQGLGQFVLQKVTGAVSSVSLQLCYLSASNHMKSSQSSCRPETPVEQSWTSL